MSQIESEREIEMGWEGRIWGVEWNQRQRIRIFDFRFSGDLVVSDLRILTFTSATATAFALCFGHSTADSD